VILTYGSTLVIPGRREATSPERSKRGRTPALFGVSGVMQLFETPDWPTLFVGSRRNVETVCRRSPKDGIFPKWTEIFSPTKSGAKNSCTSHYFIQLRWEAWLLTKYFDCSLSEREL
jgi:hypothetical protein